MRLLEMLSNKIVVVDSIMFSFISCHKNIMNKVSVVTKNLKRVTCFENDCNDLTSQSIFRAKIYVPNRKRKTPHFPCLQSDAKKLSMSTVFAEIL